MRNHVLFCTRTGNQRTADSSLLFFQHPQPLSLFYFEARLYRA